MTFQSINTSPNISVIIPARNEQDYLPLCLDAIERAKQHAQATLEIIVVLNRCTDNTEQIALARGCILARDDRKNLACIRNSGVKLAQHEIIVTVDADSTISENMFSEILKVLASKNVIGGGVAMLPERWSLGILLTALCILPVAVWHGISGGLFFCRKSDFIAIGGFDESLVSVEDIDFAKRLKCYGKTKQARFVNLYRAYIRTSCRKFDRLGDWHFIKRPWLLITLLRGRNQAEADKLWYDFKR